METGQMRLELLMVLEEIQQGKF